MYPRVINRPAVSGFSCSIKTFTSLTQLSSGNVHWTQHSVGQLRKLQKLFVATRCFISGFKQPEVKHVLSGLKRQFTTKCSLLTEVLFYTSRSFWCELLRDIGCRDVCLLSNIMGLDGKKKNSIMTRLLNYTTSQPRRKRASDSCSWQGRM